MPSIRYSLMDLLLVAMAIPIWLHLTLILSQGRRWGSSPLRYIMAPLVLCGMTFAIHHLLRGRKNAWSLSALLAAGIALVSLSLVSWTHYRLS
jgi:hypothetical protein